MPFKGTLDTLSMIDVFQVIGMTRKAGCLLVKHPGGEAKRLYFQAGEVITATSNGAKDRLGAMLVKMGILTREQVEASRKAEQVTGVKQGQALVARGLLTEEQLNRALARQIAEIFHSVMTWREGSFEFLDEEQPGPDFYLVRESVTNLIMQGTRQLDEWSLIEKVFPSMDVVVAMGPPREGTGDIRLQADEWSILTLIDGKRTLRQICGLSSSSNFEVCKKLLNLHHAGLVVAVRGDHTPPPATPSAPPPSARRVPPSFYPAVRSEFTRAVGPIAAMILEEIEETLAVSLDRLPVSRVPELLELLCGEIDSPDKRDRVRDAVKRAAEDPFTDD